MPHAARSRGPVLVNAFVIGLLAFAPFCGQAAAGELLSAEEAVRLALARPEIAAGWAADVALAEAELTAARTWDNPALSLEREAGDRALGEADETSLLLAQSFEVGGRRTLERRAAALGIDGARAEAALGRAELRAQVLRLYHDARLAEQRQAALADVVERLGRIDRIAAARQAEGDLSGFERMRIAQQLARAQLRRDEASAAAAAARAGLAGRLGIETAALQLPGEPAAWPPAAERVDGTAANLELGALALRREQAEAELAAARRWRVPVSVGIGRKRIEGVGAHADALLVELAVPLPLFDRDQAARQRAEAGLLRAEADYRLAREALLLRRETAASQARELVGSARRMEDELLPRARELARIAEASFGEGELDLPGLLAALDDESTTLDQAVELAARARHALIELELINTPTHSGDR